MDRRIIYSYLIAISANFMTMLTGLGFAWSSPCIPKLNGEMDPEYNPLGRNATLQEISWITSLHNCGAIATPFLCGLIAANYGKKKTIILFAIPQLVSNIILIFANHVVHFYVARFLIGLGTACTLTTVQLYTLEIVPTTHRGRAGTLLYWMAAITQEFVLIIGPKITIRTLAMLSLIPSIALFTLFGKFAPESPYHFVSKNNLRKAELVLLKTRKESGISKELENMVKYVEENNNFSFKEFFSSKGVRKSTLYAIALLAFQQFSGINCVYSYQQSILAQSKSILPADTSVMVVALFAIIPFMLTSRLIDSWGRKKIMITSYVGECLSLFCLGIYFRLQSLNNDILSYLNFVPIITIVVYRLSYKLGSGPVTLIWITELFPQKYIFVLNSLFAFTLESLTFIITLIFPSIWYNLGLEVALWGFAVIAILGVLFIYFVIPETKSKTPFEIQKILNNDSNITL